MDNFNFNHPELKEGEIFLYNAGKGSFDVSKWETKRLGKIAYGFKGVKIKVSAFGFKVYPMFVSAKEFERCKSPIK